MKYFLIGFLLLFSLTTHSKNNYIFTGLVKDKDSHPVQGAVVRLLSLDSIFISGTNTNTKGIFNLCSSQKKNILEISYLGYCKFYNLIDFDKLDKQNCLKDIVLQPADINIKEIIITGKSAFMQMKGDTLEYNTNKYSLPENASVRELLKLLPNVNITNNGLIFIEGKEVHKILIDGKDFFSTSTDIASKSLLGKIVDKVQVIEQKSESDKLTGFNNDNKETVINLTIKEKMKVGIITQASLGIGQDTDEKKIRHEVNGFINLLKNNDLFTVTFDKNNTNSGSGGSLDGDTSIGRIAATIYKEFNKKLFFSGTIISNLTNRAENTQSMQQTILSPEINLYDNSSKNNNKKTKNNSFETKTTWNPNTSNTLIINTLVNYDKNSEKINETFESYKTLQNKLYYGKSTTNNEGNSYSLGLDINYAHRFKKKRRVFSSTIQGNIYKNDSKEFYNSTTKMYENKTDSIINQQTKNSNFDKKISFTASYVEPITKQIFMQTAYTIRITSNDLEKSTFNIPYNYSKNDFPFLLIDQSPLTKRESFYQRLNLNYKYEGKMSDYTIGLNVDLDKTKNHTYLLNDSQKHDIDQKKINYSPIINIKHRLNKSNTLFIDYIGTLTSPTTQQLQDYTDITIPTNIIKGNPALKTQFTHTASFRFNGSNPSKQTYYNICLSSYYIKNAISITNNIDINTGYKTKSYKNINGIWGTHVTGSYNIPIKNTNFSIGNIFSTGVDNKKDLINEELNAVKNFTLENQLHINYLSANFDCRLSSLFNYNSLYRKNTQYDIRTQDWGTELSTSYLFPYKIRILSSFCWNLKKGYGESGRFSENILDISLNKEIFSKKYGSGIIQISSYDLLKSRKPISRITEASYIQNIKKSTIGNYFLFSFIYTFNIFPSN